MLLVLTLIVLLLLGYFPMNYTLPLAEAEASAAEEERIAQAEEKAS